MGSFYLIEGLAQRKGRDGLSDAVRTVDQQISQIGSSPAVLANMK